jgi:atypical dual specificity phosphatase
MTDPAMPESGIFQLRRYGVGYADKVVLAEVDLCVPDRGIVVLLGPCGTGKSTLLRTIAGHNNANPSLRTWGEASFLGAPLGTGEMPALVGQSARLMMASVLENIVCNLPERNNLTKLQQRALAARLLADAGVEELAQTLDEPVVRLSLARQRHVAIIRAVASGPRLLCLDEPTAGLGDDEAAGLIRHLRQEAEKRALIVSVHNQRHARELGGDLVLLAGGRIQERQATGKFFEAPLSGPGRDFVRGGTCAVPAPDARPEELDDAVTPPPPLPSAARNYVSDAFGPRGFLWLRRGCLAGTPLPGVYHDINYDLAALRRVGVTRLITLVEQPLDDKQLAPFGIQSMWHPVPDMGAPSHETGLAICGEINQLIEDGEVVAVHCLAGLGRTGTVLAAYLIWQGSTALDALETVRRVEPRWVQSQVQVSFLEKFAETIASLAPPRPSEPDRRIRSHPLSAARQA